MKIGVFGDSYADANCDKIWWRYLQTMHGHEVECFGVSGSSLIFSAKQIIQHHRQFDLVIWCVTSPYRVTVWHRANYKEICFHVTGNQPTRHPDQEIQDKIDAARNYLLLALDTTDANFAGRCLIEYIKHQVPNMLVIPCFPAPLYEYPETIGFNLYGLFEQENHHYFGKDALSIISNSYADARQGHLTPSTQARLSELIAVDLRPGIFSPNYEDFPAPAEKLDEVFKKK